MNNWTEQEMVDAWRLRLHPYDRSHQTCGNGHKNCALHGLCMIDEFRNIFGSDAAIIRLIKRTKPWDSMTTQEKRKHMNDTHMNKDIPTF